ncbi:MAG: protein FdrA [Acidimicrobiia bacterium]|nr:protein FdrA [Acidimicrobiia bacterium]
MHELQVLRDSYKDSVRLLEATRSMLAVVGIDYAWALMGTAANLEALAAEGFDDVEDASANDLVLAVRSADPEPRAAAIQVANDILFAAVQSSSGHDAAPAATDLAGAIAQQDGSNVAIISVPGPYASLETQKALTAGLDVLLFSDNVPLSDEIALKERARDLGRLVMGPGAGTAMIAGTGLGFANRVKSGGVGIVAAAGTGAQEAMALLDRWGVGVSHVIGVGGRDLSAEVGGLMARAGIGALEADPATDAILLVSKPPSPEVAESLLGRAPSKPMVAALIGLREDLDGVPDAIDVCNTLEQGVVLSLQRLGVELPDRIGDTPEAVAEVITALPQSRTRLVGLFSGGTLCYEAMTIATEHIGPIHSNTPLEKSWTVPAPDGAHMCLDLGEEEYTQGRPHPMIDPEARIEWLREQIADSSVAVVLLDVVLGDGSHENPASLLAPVIAEIVASGATVVAYVLGTDLDPQGFESQRKTLRDAGCIVTETAARAALAAAAIVNRDPALVHSDF